MKVVFDIDGTLSNPGHRLHFIQPEVGEKKNWDGVFAACGDDTPIPINVELCQELMWVGKTSILRPSFSASRSYVGDHIVEFWTGRREAERNVTQEWLMEHVLKTNDCYHGDEEWQDDPFPTTLKMRKDGDRRSDYIIKMEFIDPLNPPDIIFEDRSTVVRAYRERGLTVFQVAEGDF